LTSAARGKWESVFSFLDQWLRQFEPESTSRSDDAWHPYCISRRLVVWVCLLIVAKNSDSGLDEEFESRLVNSFTRQANWLLKNPEFDLGGNHLLENATALAIAGACIESEDAANWVQAAVDIFKRELRKQILPHGEHFELSPVYHCQVLANLLRIEACTPQGSDLAVLVGPWIEPMLNFLVAILHPDGEVPLLADSVFHEAPSVSEIFANVRVNERERKNCEDNSIGGYEIFRRGDFFLIADFGPIAARGLPAHGHCDALNLELSIGMDRWITDSGNFDYGDGSMRQYCRSSLAHNVVTVEDQNQANIWSKFRMGFEPRVRKLDRLDQDQWSIATASHDGYRKMGVDRVARRIAVSDNSIVCLDRCVFKQPREMRGYLHFHPDVRVELLRHSNAGQCAIVALIRGNTCKHLSFLAETVSIESAWYCPEFGKRLETAAIKYISSDFAGLTGWILHDPGKECEITVTKANVSIILPDQREFDWMQ